MKLKLATQLAAIGIFLYAILTILLSLFQLGVVSLTSINIGVLLDMQAIIQIVFVVTLTNFFISFLIAQKKGV